MHKHAKIVDKLSKRYKGQRNLAEVLSNMTGKKLSFKAISIWKQRGISFRYRGAVAELCLAEFIDIPPYFTTRD